MREDRSNTPGWVDSGRFNGPRHLSQDDGVSAWYVCEDADGPTFNVVPLQD